MNIFILISISVQIIVKTISAHLESTDLILNRRMHEICLAEFFTQSKPVWIDDLGTRK